MKHFLSVVCVLVMLASVSGCNRQNTEGGRPTAGGGGGDGQWGKPERPTFKIPVTVQEVERGRMVEYLQAVGTVVPVRELEIKPEMTGRIYFTRKWMEGDEVQAGDVLAAIDDRQLRIDIRDAQLNLETARAAVRPASAELAQAQKDEEFREQMFQRGAVSRAEVDQFRLQRIQRENSYEQALSNVNSREMALERMRQELEKVQITVPFDGVLLPPEEGTSMVQRDGNQADLTTLEEQIVSQGAIIARLANIDEVHVALDVPAKDLLDVQIGQKVELEIYSRVQREYVGVVDDISTTLNSTTRTYTVNVLVQNPDKELRPGMFAKARIITEEKPAAISIPREMVMLRNNNEIVFVAVPKEEVAPPDETELVEPLEEGSRQLTMAGSMDSLPDSEDRSDGEPGEAGDEPGEAAGEAMDEESNEPETEWVAEQRVVETGIENREFVEITGGLAEGDYLVVLGYETLTDGVDINITIREGDLLSPDGGTE